MPHAKFYWLSAPYIELPDPKTDEELKNFDRRRVNWYADRLVEMEYNLEQAVADRKAFESAFNRLQEKNAELKRQNEELRCKLKVRKNSVEVLAERGKNLTVTCERKLAKVE